MGQCGLLPKLCGGWWGALSLLLHHPAHQLRGAISTVLLIMANKAMFLSNLLLLSELGQMEGSRSMRDSSLAPKPQGAMRGFQEGAAILHSPHGPSRHPCRERTLLIAHSRSQ